MDCYTDYINIKSDKSIEFVDITEKVRGIVQSSGFKDGVVTVFTQHTTTAIRVTEHCDRLQQDMISCLEKISPSSGTYRHNEDTVDGRPNAHSHLKALFLNSSEQIPLKNGEMLLGGWQTIFFVELDGPRENRNVIINIVGRK